MTRSPPEWIARTDDDAIPRRVRVRLYIAAGGCCERCGHKIVVSDRWDVDHINPLVFGGEHREANMRVVCLPCHRDKSKVEMQRKAKSDRVRAKHIGLKRPRKIRAWRKFDGTAVFARRER